MLRSMAIFIEDISNVIQIRRDVAVPGLQIAAISAHATAAQLSMYTIL